ncbi:MULTISPECIES: PadR family transcriptional regulator [unclassified Oceanobacillus]|uniref:PadR family transcriptional regulator n=1 Tax=unclassified Oceanobacillus TaxID=2630292 RepID=UPI001E435D4A|nr:helix-turn-helix transcriptional regulator [Oceanobacillus sp. AG]
MGKRQENPMSEAMYYILLALREPLHGYAIMEKVHEISRGRIEMGPGTLYGILKRLEKDNWIELADANGRRKIYKMTALGEQALEQEYARLMDMVADGRARMLGGECDEQ